MKPLPHKMEIAIAVRKMIRAGVTMRVIHDHIQRYKDAPKSFEGFYRIYRADIADARADIQEKIGTVVVDKALQGDLKAAELFLRSKAGWNPTVKVEEVDPDTVDENVGHIDALLALLNTEPKDPKE